MEASKRIDTKRRHAKFGVVSVVIGIVNILIVIYYVRLLTLWLMNNAEIASNPASISGMPVPYSVMIKIIILLGMEIAGLLTGIFGLFEKDRRKLLPIIGIILNGLFFLFTGSKLNWGAWGEVGSGLFKLLTN